MKAKSELGGNAETAAEMTAGGPILDVNGEQIDPIWAAEFRGFFWGEGTIAVQAREPKRTGYSISIKASIGLRSDDGAILREFHRRLGGQLRTEPYRTGDRTILRWTVGTAADNLRIAQLLESPTGLLFNKARQLAIWRKAVETKLQAGAWSGARYTAEARNYQLWAAQELMRLRKWAS